MNYFEQIYTIISEALFGASGVPSEGVNFVLEQASLYISLFVLLLPLIFSVSIFVKALKL